MLDRVDASTRRPVVAELQQLLARRPRPFGDQLDRAVRSVEHPPGQAELASTLLCRGAIKDPLDPSADAGVEARLAVRAHGQDASMTERGVMRVVSVTVRSSVVLRRSSSVSTTKVTSMTFTRSWSASVEGVNTAGGLESS